ncbi:hypothetical protein SLS56_007344 [Neofusicoccum ribis]|uniref:Uncharacterized protein n=1 Tax=Neofusicoccum ribis TaxID=45134 RepID=A0ABR3SNB0_9PEZI
MSAIALRRGKSISAISTLPSRTFEYTSLSSIPVLEIDRIAEVSHMKDAYDQYDRAMNLYDRILGRLPSYKPRWYTRHCLGLLGIEAHWTNQLPLFLNPPLNLKHLREDAYEYSNTLSDVGLFAREAFEAYLITSIARCPIEARVLTNVVYYPILEPRLVSQLWVPCRQVDLEDPAITVAHLAELPFRAHLHYLEDSVADLDELPFQEQIKKAIATVPLFGDIPWNKINLPLLDETDIEIEEDFKKVDVADMQTIAQNETYLLENSEDCVDIFVPEDAQAPSKLSSSYSNTNRMPNLH